MKLWFINNVRPMTMHSFETHRICNSIPLSFALFVLMRYPHLYNVHKRVRITAKGCKFCIDRRYRANV